MADDNGAKDAVIVPDHDECSTGHLDTTGIECVRCGNVSCLQWVAALTAPLLRDPQEVLHFLSYMLRDEWNNFAFTCILCWDRHGQPPSLGAQLLAAGANLATRQEFNQVWLSDFGCHLRDVTGLSTDGRPLRQCASTPARPEIQARLKQKMDSQKGGMTTSSKDGDGAGNNRSDNGLMSDSGIKATHSRTPKRKEVGAGAAESEGRWKSGQKSHAKGTGTWKPSTRAGGKRESKDESSGEDGEDGSDVEHESEDEDVSKDGEDNKDEDDGMKTPVVEKGKGVGMWLTRTASHILSGLFSPTGNKTETATPRATPTSTPMFTPRQTPKKKQQNKPQDFKRREKTSATNGKPTTVSQATGTGPYRPSEPDFYQQIQQSRGVIPKIRNNEKPEVAHTDNEISEMKQVMLQQAEHIKCLTEMVEVSNRNAPVLPSATASTASSITQDKEFLISLVRTAVGTKGSGEDKPNRSQPFLKVAPIELTKFDGDYLTYASFIKVLDYHINRQKMTEVEKFAVLKVHLEGAAADKVADLSSINPSSYKTARELLHEIYGDRFATRDLAVQEFNGYIGTSAYDGASLDAATDRLRILVTRCREVGIPEAFLTTSMGELLRKLPTKVREDLLDQQVGPASTFGVPLTIDSVLLTMRKHTR